MIDIDTSNCQARSMIFGGVCTLFSFVFLVFTTGFFPALFLSLLIFLGAAYMYYETFCDGAEEPLPFMKTASEKASEVIAASASVAKTAVGVSHGETRPSLAGSGSESTAGKTSATHTEKPDDAPSPAPDVAANSVEEAKTDEEVKQADVTERAPHLFTSQPSEVDDLKKISGVGPKLEGTLNDLGIYQYAQIASWNKADIAYVDARLKFKGRIERDDWISQARALKKGK